MFTLFLSFWIPKLSDSNLWYKIMRQYVLEVIMKSSNGGGLLRNFLAGAIRKRPKLTLRALEEKSGISRSEISNIIRGVRKNPSTESLVALAKPLEVDPRFLILLASGLTFRDVEELKDKYGASKHHDQLDSLEEEFMEEQYFIRKILDLSDEAKAVILQVIKLDEVKKKSSRSAKLR